MKPEPKKQSRYSGIIGIIVIILIFWAGCKACGSENNTAPLDPKTQRQKQIADQFSAWDGSHIKLTELIKQTMNDPGSFKHVETKYWDLKDHLVVLEVFRGKNSFGGIVKNFVKAEVDMDGNVIKIIQSSE